MSELTPSQKDPLAELEAKTQDELKVWLQDACWSGKTYPVINGDSFEISEVLKQGSPELKTRVRRVVPDLLQEWGRDDPSGALDDLLIISGRLRCAGASVVISQILSERLRNRRNAIPLRQRCLAVLSGFGCTDKTVHIFERYIGDANYAAICYRALYRYDLDYAANALPGLIKLFKQSGAIHEIGDVIEDLADDLQSHDEARQVVIKYLKVGDPNELVYAVELFRKADILTTDMMLEASAKLRQQFSHLLLTRSAPASMPGLIMTLEKVGASLHKVEGKNDEETMEFRVADKITERKTAEKITATTKLAPATISAIADANELLAVAAFAGKRK